MEILSKLLQLKDEDCKSGSLLDTQGPTSGIELLRLRFCATQASFYDLEILNPRKVNLYLLTVDKLDLLDPAVD